MFFHCEKHYSNCNYNWLFAYSPNLTNKVIRTFFHDQNVQLSPRIWYPKIDYKSYRQPGLWESLCKLLLSVLSSPCLTSLSTRRVKVKDNARETPWRVLKKMKTYIQNHKDGTLLRKPNNQVKPITDDSFRHILMSSVFRTSDIWCSSERVLQ